MNEKRSYIAENEKISIRKQCELLNVNRRNVYKKALGESDKNLKIMRKLDVNYLDHPTNGVLQMQDYLMLLGFFVNH